MKSDLRALSDLNGLEHFFCRAWLQPCREAPLKR